VPSGSPTGTFCPSGIEGIRNVRTPLETTIVLPEILKQRTILALSGLANLKTSKEGNMGDLAKEKRDKIAQKMGWSQRRAQGYIEGRFYRRSGQDMPECHQAGRDDYSKGFKIGYNRQNHPDSEAKIQKEPLAS
jgi:hypothetical protein